MKLIEEIYQMVSESKFREAIKILSDHIELESDDKVRAALLFERGKLYWRTGNRQQAKNDYLKATILDSDSPAVTALEHCDDIESFFNPDLINP